MRVLTRALSSRTCDVMLRMLCPSICQSNNYKCVVECATLMNFKVPNHHRVCVCLN